MIRGYIKSRMLLTQQKKAHLSEDAEENAQNEIEDKMH